MHDRFLSEYRVFFSNIEDFLWFKLALVRCYEKQPGGTGEADTAEGGVRVAGHTVDSCTAARLSATALYQPPSAQVHSTVSE